MSGVQVPLPLPLFFIQKNHTSPCSAGVRCLSRWKIAMDQAPSPANLAQKKGNPLTAKMQPAGLNLYPLPQGRLHKSTLNEIWQDQGVILLLLTGLFCHSAAYDGALTVVLKGRTQETTLKRVKKCPLAAGNQRELRLGASAFKRPSSI